MDSETGSAKTLRRLALRSGRQVDLFVSDTRNPKKNDAEGDRSTSVSTSQFNCFRATPTKVVEDARLACTEGQLLRCSNTP